MESIISYIIIILLVTVSIFVYNIRKKQTRDYILSIQNYPKLNFGINIQKNEGNIAAILLKIYPLSNIRIIDMKIELITADRGFNYYCLESITDNANLPIELIAHKDVITSIPFDKFKSLLTDGEHPFRTFRFVIYDSDQKAYKSHELGFNKKWVIYRPDSGSYN